MADFSDHHENLQHAIPHKEDQESLPLRDQIARIMNEAHIELSPKFLRQKRDGQTPVDIIRANIGYYRLYEDRLNQNRVLVFAYASDLLKSDTLSNIDPDSKIYVVSTRHKTADGIDFLGDIQEHQKELKQASLYYLTLHTDELAREYPDDVAQDKKRDLRVVRFTNGELAFGAFEKYDGKWDVRLYLKTKEDTENVGFFVNVATKLPANFLTRAFTLSEGRGEFDTFDDAFKFIRERWNTKALRIWKGHKSPLLEDGSQPNKPAKFSSRIRSVARSAISTVKGVIFRRAYRPYVLGFAVPVIAASMMTGFGQVGLAFLAGALSVEIGVKLSEGILGRFWHKLAARSDEKNREKHIPLADRNLVKDYALNTEQNLSRWCMKFDPEKTKNLEPLSHEAGDLMYDDGTIIPMNADEWRRKWLLGSQNNTFGTICTVLSKHAYITHNPNGTVSLVTTNPNTQETCVYLHYDADDLVSEDAPLPEDIKDSLDDGAIHKIAFERGKPIQRGTVTMDVFQNELSAVFAHSAQSDTPPHSHVFGENVTDYLRHVFSNAQKNKKKPFKGYYAQGGFAVPIP